MNDDIDADRFSVEFFSLVLLWTYSFVCLSVMTPLHKDLTFKFVRN